MRSEAMTDDSLYAVLRNVMSAKQQWADEHGKTDGADVTFRDLAPFLLPDSRRLPEGYLLIPNPVGRAPVIVRPDGLPIGLPDGSNQTQP